MKNINAEELKAMVGRVPLNDEELEKVAGGDAYSDCKVQNCLKFEPGSTDFFACIDRCRQSTYTG